MSPSNTPLTSSQQAALAMGIPLFIIHTRGFDKLVFDIGELESNFDKDSKEVLRKGSKLFREATQERSPYLYGILRGAHFDDLIEGDDPMGLVAIDPSVWHPILGGYPNEYGARIHGEGRPWFAWTIDQEGDRIMGNIGSELAGIYPSYLGGYT